MKDYKEKYKTGMIFRSKKDPWTDLVIDFVSYIRGSETAYTMKIFHVYMGSIGGNLDMAQVWIEHIRKLKNAQNYILMSLNTMIHLGFLIIHEKLLEVVEI